MVTKCCGDKVYGDKVYGDKVYVDKVYGDKVWRRAEEEKAAEEEPGIQNQKQEPHTKMWGKTNQRRPANPPARFAFRQKDNKPDKNGAGAQQQHPQHKRICRSHSGSNPL